MINNSPEKRRQLLRWGIEMIQALFPVLLITILSLLLLESLFQGSVSSYLNLDWMLRTVILSGILSILVPGKSDSRRVEPMTARNIFIMVCSVIGSIVIISYKTQGLGWFSLLLSIAGGGVVLLLALIRQEDEGETVEGENNPDN